MAARHDGAPNHRVVDGSDVGHDGDGMPTPPRGPAAFDPPVWAAAPSRVTAAQIKDAR
jgi:hypothetical protein